MSYKGIVCDHCGKFLDFSGGTEDAVAVVCLYCKEVVQVSHERIEELLPYKDVCPHKIRPIEGEARGHRPMVKCVLCKVAWTLDLDTLLMQREGIHGLKRQCASSGCSRFWPFTATRKDQRFCSERCRTYENVKKHRRKKREVANG